MPVALKLQWDIGGPDDFDATGGEPHGSHGTIAEIDPATDEQVELARQLHEGMKMLPFSGKLFGTKAKLIIRKMDSDGRV